MPFGSRASSYHMQTVANAIVSVLADRGVVARMYLDDIVTLSPGREKALRDHQVVKDLLEELGLPEAVDKAQPPAQKLRWLGIDIDGRNMTLSIPYQKVTQTLQVVERAAIHCGPPHSCREVRRPGQAFCFSPAGSTERHAWKIY